MQIAELFILLGMKGTDDVDKSLKNTKSGLGEAKSMALETKAAILAVVYGLQQLTSASNRTGTELTLFGSATGLSTKWLQQMQFAARQVGVEASEITGSIKSVQDSMTEMLLHGKAPAGMSTLANLVGFDMNQARDTQYVMEQLQKLMQSVPPDIGKSLGKSFGLSENVMAAMRQNAFRPDVFAKAPAYSEREAESLTKVGAAWANLGQKIEMAIGHLNAKHGMQLINDLSKVTSEILKLTEALIVLGEKAKVFQWMGMAFKGLGMLIGNVTETIGNVEKEGIKSRGKAVLEQYKSFGKLAVDSIEDFVSPNMTPPATQNNQRKEVNNNVNVQVHNHGVKDAKEGAHHFQRAVSNIYRQKSAQGEGP